MNYKLPLKSFAKLPTTGETVLICRGETGYFPQDSHIKSRDADELNEILGVTKAQAEAMFKGSMFGWDVPAADPDMYDENGHPKKKG